MPGVCRTVRCGRHNCEMVDRPWGAAYEAYRGGREVEQMPLVCLKCVEEARQKVKAAMSEARKARRG